MVSINDTEQLEMENDLVGDPDQPLAERQLLTRLTRMIEASDKVIKTLETRWAEAYDYWRGEQWNRRDARKTKGKTWNQAVANTIFPIMERKPPGTPCPVQSTAAMKYRGPLCPNQ